MSYRGSKVDRDKVEVIEKLPPPTNVKGVRNSLGHANYDASKTLDSAQVNYATTEKQLLIVVFIMEKF